jgi:hypothetical protein
MKLRSSLLAFAGLLLLVLVAVPAALVMLSIQPTPLVLEADQLTPERAQQARDLTSRISSEVLGSEHPEELVLDRDELNGLLALAGRAFPRLKGRVNFGRSDALAAMTVRLPDSVFGGYLNLAVIIESSENGLAVTQGRTGSVTWPGWLVVPTATLALNLVLGDGNGTALVGMVERVSIADGKMRIGFGDTSDFQARMASIRSRFRQARDNAALLGDPETVRTYYREIVQMAEVADPDQSISLASYMGPLFAFARYRSRNGSAVKENQAAILALAIYFGSSRFEILTGPVVPEDMATYESRAGRTTLAGRRDSCLHFVYSAVLKIASNAGAGFALGEFKELVDSGPKGSGFSFADLAADRAGVSFAEVATRDEVSALHLQEVLSQHSTESVFFPQINDLPEDLPRETFEVRYGGVNSRAYAEMVAEIDRRLRELAVYGTRAE